ncbi:hypothetical protein [Draconibacterium halophilum]|uniref:Uncharacterized protein n=1 Tax=Draconibacterium halophilum TaxID=2706887 RepID=A0A6C0REN1_9BACT|nr:hypothetical protein [Draconibacterium halophilum]QIA08850.1 hypothetical protein G0Q07_14475 [Draconibacterium halophilum]
MAEINKELEEKIKLLIKQGKPIEAVSLVQQELQLGLRNSKEIVDKYRNEKK